MRQITFQELYESKDGTLFSIFQEFDGDEPRNLQDLFFKLKRDSELDFVEQIAGPEGRFFITQSLFPEIANSKETVQAHLGRVYECMPLQFFMYELQDITILMQKLLKAYEIHDRSISLGVGLDLSRERLIISFSRLLPGLDMPEAEATQLGKQIAHGVAQLRMRSNKLILPGQGFDIKSKFNKE